MNMAISNRGQILVVVKVRRENAHGLFISLLFCILPVLSLFFALILLYLSKSSWTVHFCVILYSSSFAIVLCTYLALSV